MAKYEKINGSWFNVESFKGITKAQFLNKYKDKRKFNFNSEDTYSKIQNELKKLEPDKPTK